MAQGRDAGERSRRRRGVLRHYDRPLWRDRMFWVVALPSVLATAVIVGLLLVLWGVPDSALAWVRIVVVGLIVLNLGFRLLGFSLVTTRHFQRGLGEGSAKREGDWEDKGRAAGAVVGRAIASTRKVTSGTSAASESPHRSDNGPTRDAVDDPPQTEPDHATEPSPSTVTQPTPGPTASPSSASAPEPSTKETVDKAARVVGGMVGRRLAERRRKQG
jgi:hypothetical protein